MSVVAVALLCFATSAVVGSVVRSRIQAELRKTFSVELKTSLVWYLPPWGVSLHGVRLTTIQPDGSRSEFFKASRIVVKLGSYPKAGKPLRIDKLIIDSPSVTLAGKAAPAASAGAAAATDIPSVAEKSSPRRAASEKFRIRELRITGGRFAWLNPGCEPFVLDHIQVTGLPSPGSAQLYKFSIAADQAASAQVLVAGAIGFDDFVLGLSELTIQAKAGAILSEIPLEPSIRRILTECNMQATLEVRGSASVPLHDWENASFKADVQLHGGAALLPGEHRMQVDDVEADIHLQGASGPHGIQGELRKLVAKAGGTQLCIDAARFSTAADGKSWRLADLRGRLDANGGVPALDHCQLHGRFIFTGAASGPAWIPMSASLSSAVQHELILYPRDASVQPWLFPIPVDHIAGGPISLRGGVVYFENLSGNYGGDKVLLNKAHITLDDSRQRIGFQDMRREVRIEDIDGTLICHQPGPLYPAELGKIIEQLRPSGPFIIGGGSWFGINVPVPGRPEKSKPDFFFRISSTKGAFALTDHQAPLTAIRGDATVSPMLVDITNLRGEFLGGTVIASGKVTPVLPVHYDASGTFYNVNLALAQRQLGVNMQKPLVGQMYLKANVSGYGKGGPQTPLKSLAANGEFEIVEGNFGDISAVRAAAGKVTKPDQRLDGTAAGVFDIGHETVTLQSCAVGNPLFGLQGAGTIGFDKTLDLHAVAAPLGDWQVALRQSNVPIVADVGSGLAGAIQQIFNGAQHALLWDIHICGRTDAPNVEFTPAPVITAPLAALFGQMMRPEKSQHLIEPVKAATQKSRP
jgi:hypothetical protein